MLFYLTQVYKSVNIFLRSISTFFVVMKKLLTLLTIFIFTTTYSQEKTTLFKSKIVLDSNVISNIHILNKKTNIGTITNNNGEFEIPVQIGDSLFISHINLEEKVILIDKENISNKKNTINLKEKTYQLESFTLQKPRSIFYVDKEIMPDNGVVVNAKTLHLPYANTLAKEDKAVFKFRSGGVVNLDNFINKINGNFKQEKLIKELKYEDNQLIKIRQKFTDDFFINNLKIKKEYINQFLNYCISKNIISVFNKGNTLKLTSLLLEESRLFAHKIINEDVLLTKN